MPIIMRKMLFIGVILKFLDKSPKSVFVYILTVHIHWVHCLSSAAAFAAFSLSSSTFHRTLLRVSKGHEHGKTPRTAQPYEES